MSYWSGSWPFCWLSHHISKPLFGTLRQIADGDRQRTDTPLAPSIRAAADFPSRQKFRYPKSAAMGVSSCTMFMP